MFRSRPTLLFLLLVVSFSANATKLLIPMDGSQQNHLKAYGIAFWTLGREASIEWLLNYRGGSFLIDHYTEVEKECTIRGVSFQIIADGQANAILAEIGDPEVNMEVVKLEKAPKIAVYAPDGFQPWDDAVAMVMTYAEIPYERIYDKQIIAGVLPQYDWLHLHHEDFTGQYGKFYRMFRSAPWYQASVKESEEMAASLGFAKVSQMKLAVALKIRDYVSGGGYLFTMCSGTDSYDIALSAEGVDICTPEFDHDPIDPQAQDKIDFGRTFAFKDFRLVTDPMVYEFSNIDATDIHNGIGQTRDFFTLFDFSAKWDVVPTMLCQSHEQVVRGFMGQTTAFRRSLVKPGVLVMGENKAQGTVKYIHGEFGLGQWTFYGGHDPEDYQHMVNDPPTDLSLHPNSAGYRLILNNILFPAARKKKQKT
ncbi:MAG: asparagine synthetase B [Flavobacteriales bacterium]|nr:asparagine synthetase B [Flavobacteriales bacterium]MBK7618488.1 asparagine synthetase B [Flavobacteriales bacterium]